MHCEVFECLQHSNCLKMFLFLLVSVWRTKGFRHICIIVPPNQRSASIMGVLISLIFYSLGVVGKSPWQDIWIMWKNEGSGRTYAYSEIIVFFLKTLKHLKLNTRKNWYKNNFITFYKESISRHLTTFLNLNF